MTNTVLMPVGAFFSCLAIGWFISENKTFKEWLSPSRTFKALKDDGLDVGKFTKVFAFMLKYVGPALIAFIEVFGIIGKIKENGTHYWWVIVFSLALILLSVILYFRFFKNSETGNNADELELEESAQITK
jgi:hypothetical protein